MKVYLAACFEQQQEVVTKAAELERIGIEVTSRWRFEDTNVPQTPERFDECARVDIADVQRADYFVLLADQTSTRGGKHFETGYAYGIGKPIMVVCRRENVFHWLTNVVFCETWTEAVARLGATYEAIQDQGVLPLANHASEAMAG